jgi:hypothetical protein
MTHEQQHPGQHAHNAARLARAGRLRLAAALLCSGLCAAAPVLAAPGENSRHDAKADAGEAYATTSFLDTTPGRNPKSDPAMDPFIAGALGIIPFSSGLYISERPARGLIFTAVDILMVMGVYTSRYTAAGDPNNARNYFILMAVNNVLDAWVSVRYANMRQHTALILPTPEGGLQASLYWRF